MPKIRISHETLRSTAKSISQCQTDQQEIISKISQMVETLRGGWEGEARVGFEAAFEAAKPMYQQFAPDLQKFADFLNMYSGKMEDVDVAGRERFKDAIQSA